MHAPASSQPRHLLARTSRPARTLQDLHARLSSPPAAGTSRSGSSASRASPSDFVSTNNRRRRRHTAGAHLNAPGWNSLKTKPYKGGQMLHLDDRRLPKSETVREQLLASNYLSSSYQESDGGLRFSKSKYGQGGRLPSNLRLRSRPVTAQPSSLEARLEALTRSPVLGSAPYR
jgi:hypothetical protein